MTNKQNGSYVAVSAGMLLAGHISVRAKKIVEEADIVLSLMPHPIAENWLASISNKHISLQSYYGEGKHRKQSYDEMIQRILDEVKQGKNVCGVFYGHAGVFAWVPHESVRLARGEGYSAYMEPGISAEACLYSDLGIDPGSFGIHSYEASQFLFYGHQPNVTSYLLLWQVALAGETTARTFKTSRRNLEIFVEYLLQWYPKEHKIILYEAAFLPLDKVRKDELNLEDLPMAKLNLHTTMVVPPAKKMSINKELVEKLGLDELLMNDKQQQV
ncbi:SAM-dependent methyltransferase [Kangiella sediminilitoris]|uniref:Uroporphyrin-III C-methyltransferase n=1 Tax=Kangiella sediminilitoris TaxID=1144748 RepID=A0A1B3B7X6_9GAMM|nr:SAM-dependent methyltransferase [Kangiella sediminilitoris]AOE48892.1 uroporphyrin-III C-methyltransferase [Kangiella sediminilitoris]